MLPHYRPVGRRIFGGDGDDGDHDSDVDHGGDVDYGGDCDHDGDVVHDGDVDHGSVVDLDGDHIHDGDNDEKDKGRGEEGDDNIVKMMIMTKFVPQGLPEVVIQLEGYSMAYHSLPRGRFILLRVICRGKSAHFRLQLTTAETKVMIRKVIMT